MITRFGRWGAPALLALTHLRPAYAMSGDEAIGRAELTLKQLNIAVGDIVNAKGAAPPTATERLAVGELFLRQKQYDRAIDAFSKVVELHRQGKTNAEVRADGLYLLAESYFRDDQLLAARRHFQTLAELGVKAPYDAYVGRALGRLVDVALRTDRVAGLDFVFAQLDRVAGSDTNGTTAYARGKAHFARKDYQRAIRALQGVGKRSPVYPQAQYLMGVIYTKRAVQDPPLGPSKKEAALVPRGSRRFAKAIIQFQRVALLKVKDEQHKHVRDLAWMALGRLFYETDDPLDAVDAYEHVNKKSPEFPRMLSELSWTFVRLERFDQAQRALGVLDVVSPEELEFAEGALLKADLMLRGQDFDNALRAYRSVRDRFEPIQKQVDEFLARTKDPAVYYDRLIEDRMGIKTEHSLPPVLVKWLGDTNDDPVFSLIDDVTRARKLLHESTRMVERMNAVLGSETRSQAFPEVRGQLEQTIALINRLTLAERDLALGLEDANPDALEGEIGRARSDRRSVMDRLNWLPSSARDFARRDESGRKVWRALSQKLQRIQLQADGLQAIVNGLKRVLREPDKYGVPDEPGMREQFKAELEANEGDLRVYRDTIQAYRDDVDRGRVQVGFGDARYARDEQARRKFSQSFQTEMMLAAKGAAGDGAADYAGEVLPLLKKLNAMETKLQGLRRGFETQVLEGARQHLAAVADEQKKVARYADDLKVLDQRARLFVGEAAMQSFGRVRERIRSIVLRADVGIAQQAWEVRQASLERMRDLQRRRAKEQNALDKELKEVLE